MRCHCVTVNIHFLKEDVLLVNFFKILFLLPFMCMCVYVGRGWPWRPEEGTVSPVVEVTRNCEPSHMGCWDSKVLWKSGKHS